MLKYTRGINTLLWRKEVGDFEFVCLVSKRFNCFSNSYDTFIVFKWYFCHDETLRKEMTLEQAVGRGYL